MKITAVNAVPFILPYHSSFHMATGGISEAAHVLIRIEVDEGLTGVAEAMSRSMIYGESQASIVEAVRAWFAPALIGLDPFATEHAQTKLRSVVANETAKGAIDMALHDLRGKIVGEPTWRLLGGAASSLRVSRMLGTGETEEVVEEAVQAREMYGINSFKVKIDADLERGMVLLTALRRALGEGAFLYVDPNQSLTAEATLTCLERLADLSIVFLEEPVAQEDLVGRARIAAASGIAIMADESARTVEAAALQATAGSTRAFSIKPARSGFTESSRILGLARGLSCRTVIGSQGDSAVGAITSTTFGAAFEMTAREPAEVDYFLGLADQLVAVPPTISNGRISVDPSVAGNGVEIDEDKLAFYRLDT